MKIWILAGAFVVAGTLGAAAQTTPPTTTTETPAVTAPDAPAPTTAPVEGANSFTEAQAKSRLEESGYSDIGSLAKDDQGIWRGKAKKDGKDVTVALDYQGNIVAQ